MASVPTHQGQIILSALIKVIQDNKQYLSDIDGLIGDGDHGINMNKGFTLCQEELGDGPYDLSLGLKTLYQVLMNKIGGSMGPLYGMFFKAMAKACKGQETLDAKGLGQMLLAAKDKVLDISGAQLGDKTLLDTLIPAQEAYQAALEANESFVDCLSKMSTAAEVGRDETKDMMAKVGRSSRLGERSRGVLDAGATSCCLILQTLATTIQDMLA
jgi:phosphoenolpyruvate---glycerone phosphotransferase subunit DhaL